jgi:hypothetical protein
MTSGEIAHGSSDVPVLVKVADRNAKTHAVLYGETASGAVRLRQLSDSADPETRTFEVRYVLGSLGANASLGASYLRASLSCGKPYNAFFTHFGINRFRPCFCI